MLEQFKDMVTYRFFDKTFPAESHYYTHKNLTSPPCSVEIVKENCDNVVKVMEAKGLAVLRQIHSKIVHIATMQTQYGKEPEADGIVTDIPKLVLGIQTADCVPVLFACKSGKVIGAAHCGFKGARMDLTKEVIKKMRELGAREIAAIIGPSIKQDSYEVSLEYYEEFMTLDVYNKTFFKKGKPGHYYFDLPSYVKYKISLAGVKEVEVHPDDTYQMEDKYYSWRRCCHKNTPYEGNLLSTIMIK